MRDSRMSVLYEAINSIFKPQPRMSPEGFEHLAQDERVRAYAADKGVWFEFAKGMVRPTDCIRADDAFADFMEFEGGIDLPVEEVDFEAEFLEMAEELGLGRVTVETLAGVRYFVGVKFKRPR